MTVALINASPKVKGSSSGILLNDLKECLGSKVDIEEISLRTGKITKEIIEQLKKADTWVVAFPLYVDSLPSHLLACLKQLEKMTWKKPNLNIYGIANCGFYEGNQAEPALNVLKNWCAKAGCAYKGSLGIGGGGAIAVSGNMSAKAGPRANIYKAMKKFAERIVKKEGEVNKYATVAFPRFIYKIAAQNSWRKMIKKNGGKKKDLSRRLDQLSKEDVPKNAVVCTE